MQRMQSPHSTGRAALFGLREEIIRCGTLYQVDEMPALLYEGQMGKWRLQ